MTFGREKRLLLGWMALAVPIPLPFNEVLEWPVLFLYCLAVIYFVQRADRDPQFWLPNWALNLLGLAYLPFLVVDLQLSLLRQGPVKALLHLILFLVVVKLYSIRQEKDKWYVLVAIYFLFLGAMATSSHVSIGIYLIAFLAISLFALATLAYLHVLAAFGASAKPALTKSGTGLLESGLPGSGLPGSGLPVRRPLAAGVLLILAVAIPLFAVMPRIREPFILGSGGTSGIGRTTGFSDSVDLSLTSAIRTNRRVAMRVQYSETIKDGGLSRPAEKRFKGATYDRYENRNWYRHLQQAEVLTARGRAFRLADGEPVSAATVFLEPLASSSLILPVEAMTVTVDQVRALGRDPGGAVMLPGLPRRDTLRYEVALDDRPRIVARLDPNAESELSALDTDGLTPRMRELAVELMGEGADGEQTDADRTDGDQTDGDRTDGDRIDRLEQSLLTGYAYTVDFVGRDGQKPLEDFLFVYRSGHCEYFASSMVLLLRSQGIPARFVTGFLGAEYNPLEDYYIVRQQNAHAWVEAYTPERGWQIYDPTPPDGRPAIAQPSLKLLLTQLYDYITFRWDRYVLTYGADDQRSFFEKLRERLQKLWADLKDRASGEREAATGADGVEAGSGEVRGPAVWQPRLPELMLMLAALLVVAGLIWWKRRRPLTGEAAYRQLRRRLGRAGLAITDTLAPLELESLAAERYPAAVRPLRRLVALYLGESFAERALDVDEREELRAVLGAILAAIKAEDRDRRRAGSALPAQA